MKSAFINLLAIIFGLLILTGCASIDKSASQDIIVSPQKGKFDVSVTSTGELQAKNSIQIYGPQGGRQAGIYQMKISRIIPEGTLVKKGDFIADLDKSEVVGKIAERELSLQKAQSQYTQAVLDTALTLSEARDNIANLKYTMQEKQYEIQQAIYEAPATQKKLELDYEKAERTYEQAIANYQKRIAQSVAKVKEVESDLHKEQKFYNDLITLLQEFTVMAPENGMLIYQREWNGKKRVAGSMISPWDPVVATLPDLTEMESITYINEIDIQKIKKGQAVKIGLDAVPDKYLNGVINEVANIGEQQPNSDSKVFEVKITVSDSDTTLRPAMTTSNDILVDSRESTLYLPLECLHAADSISFVFKQTTTGLIRQEVRSGLINENNVEILQGLDLKDKIFLSFPADTAGLPFVPLETIKISEARLNNH
ncbi:MAG: HlyD family efflux transporter periplasmic adaptor subunit [Bacteroidia bacterium]|nr:HlyD family efflux transporter periplasmic adaptor subunit [Bacteroidia bacterium]